MYVINSVKGRDLREKKAVSFPGEFDKVSAIANKLKSKNTIEVDRILNILNDNLNHELFSRVYISTHNCSPGKSRDHDVAKHIQ